MVIGPLWFSKSYALAALLILGVSAWCFFRESRLSPAACLLGGLATTLNSTYFSAACWGVGEHAITVAMAFLALAALADTVSPRRWLRVALAGFALGMGVTEGADIGAIFSAFVAVFIVYQSFVVEGPRARNLAGGAVRLGLVIVCAAFLAVESVAELLNTSVNAVHGLAGRGFGRRPADHHRSDGRRSAEGKAGDADGRRRRRHGRHGLLIQPFGSRSAYRGGLRASPFCPPKGEGATALTLP